MSTDYMGWAILVLLFSVASYFIGSIRTEIKEQDLWLPRMEKLSRYKFAVDDLNRWCGSTSPHARLIAAHLAAHGEGTGCNTGTPVGDEACTIMGLREQLKRLDADKAAELLAAARGKQS